MKIKSHQSVRGVMYQYLLTSGFWPRVRARALRAPVILISLPNGALRAPRLSQLRCFYLSPKAFPQVRTRPPGVYIFPLG